VNTKNRNQAHHHQPKKDTLPVLWSNHEAHRGEKESSKKTQKKLTKRGEKARAKKGMKKRGEKKRKERREKQNVTQENQPVSQQCKATGAGEALCTGSKTFSQRNTRGGGGG